MSVSTLFTRNYVRLLIGGLCMLALALVCNFYAGSYATLRASNAVSDIFLDVIPMTDVSFVFVYGTLLFWIITILVLIARPREIPFWLKAVSLFVFIRSGFIIMTHIGPFPHAPIRDPYSILYSFTFGADLFFSGHTGLPFLMALMYWRSPTLRAFFLFSSVAFGLTVLIGHLHYSIDVFGAFFITYSIYHLARYFFPEEHDLFLSQSVPLEKAR